MLVFFEGFSQCSGNDLATTLETCYIKSKTEHGSSKKWPKTIDLVNVSMLSANKTINPVFFNWSKVFIVSCDGSGHQGYKEEPVSYRGDQMYFRGTNNTLQHFKYLNESYQLFSRPLVVLAGDGNGGLAALMWSNYLKENAPQSKIHVIADSAVIVTDHPSPLTNHTPALEKALPLFKLINTEVKMPNKECVAEYPNQRECFIAGVLANYIKTPVFLIESQYDLWAIHNVLELDCVPNGEGVSLFGCDINDERAIRQYRNVSLKAFQNFTKIPEFGIWAISCVQHVFSMDDSFNSPFYAIPTQSKNTIARVLEEYLANPAGNNIHIDKV